MLGQVLMCQPGKHYFFLLPHCLKAWPEREGRAACTRCFELNLERGRGLWQSHHPGSRKLDPVPCRSNGRSTRDAHVDAAGMLKIDRKPEDGSMGQLVSLCLCGHGTERGGSFSSPGWGQRRGPQGWTYGAVPLGPIAWPGSAYSSRPEATGGFRGSRLGCWLMDSPASPIFEKDLSPQGGSGNPFLRGKRLASSSRASPREDLASSTCLWPAWGLGRVLGATGGRGAQGHRREGPRVPGGSWP